MARLGQECVLAGKTELYERVRGILAGEESNIPYSEIASHLGMSPGAFKVAVHRLRQRYGELLREEIAQTVQTQEELEEEIGFLCSALS